MIKITLASARLNAGFTQAKAAKEIGVSISTLRKWEKGETFPTQPDIEKICALYGIPYDNIKFNV